MNGRRAAIIAVVAFFVLAAVAVPASADPGNSGDGGGKGGKGGGNGGGKGGGGGHSGSNGSDGGGNSKSSGGGNQGSSGSEGSRGGSSNSGSPSGSGASDGTGPSSSSSTKGDDASSSDSSDQGGRPAATGSDGARGSGTGSDSDPSGSSGHGPDRSNAGGRQASTVPQEHEVAPAPDDPAPAATPVPAKSGGAGSGGISTLFGLLTDDVESSGATFDTIKDRTDLAELFATDVESPAVSAGLIVLAIGAMTVVFGAVRTEGSGLVGRLSIRRSPGHAAEDASVYEDAAISAGLPEAKWTGLEASSYRRLRALDAHTVAFWMGSDLASVRRWQAGRTLAEDLQDGIAVPNRSSDEEWVMNQERRAPAPDVVPETVATE